MKYIGFIFFSLLFFGCQDQTDKNKIFFGGEIINPKADVVFLMQHDKIIDSIPLKNDHTFGKYIAEIPSGLYYFKHGYEFQYLYLEPKDSISIRLNTWDFDETLVFDGIGADKNELLLDLFLINEKEITNFYTYFSLDEAVFETKINGALSRHSILLEQLKESNQELSKEFIHLAKGAIDYPIFRLKELYPFYHQKSLPKDSIFTISQNYYDFRENINLNDTIMSGYYGYQNYVTAHLYNSTLQESKTYKFDKRFRDILLKQIIDKIHLSELKNRLIYKEIENMLFNGSSKIEQDQLALFYKNSTDSIAVNTINKILKAKEELEVGSQFENFDIVSQQKDTLSIKELIKDKNTVLYFLSSTFDSNDYLSKRINYLSEQYPAVNFIGIHPNTLVQKTSTLPHKIDRHYYLTNNGNGKELFFNKYPRTILIDPNGIVKNNYTLLTNKHIEKQLKNLLAKH